MVWRDDANDQSASPNRAFSGYLRRGTPTPADHRDTQLRQQFAGGSGEFVRSGPWISTAKNADLRTTDRRAHGFLCSRPNGEVGRPPRTRSSAAGAYPLPPPRRLRDLRIRASSNDRQASSSTLQLSIRHGVITAGGSKSGAVILNHRSAPKYGAGSSHSAASGHGRRRKTKLTRNL